MAEEALRHFEVQQTEIKPLVHAENTTYRVSGPDGDWCLRIGRPGYQSDANVRSELEFLAALVRAGHRVPVPHEAGLVRVRVASVPEERSCVLFRWQEGEFRPEGYDGDAAYAVGVLMAGLHEFAVGWDRPTEFQRPDLSGGPLALEVAEIDALDPARISTHNRDLLHQINAEYVAVRQELPKTDTNYGLIHADLHHGNVLFRDGVPAAIDFDDSGFHYFAADFASALAYGAKRDDFAVQVSSMAEGYASVRPLPPGLTEVLPTFLRRRFATVSKWLLSRTDSEWFRNEAPKMAAELCARAERISDMLA